MLRVIDGQLFDGKHGEDSSASCVTLKTATFEQKQSRSVPLNRVTTLKKNTILLIERNQAKNRPLGWKVDSHLLR